MRAEAGKRAALVFSLLDANKDGVLEEADFALMADRLAGAADRSTAEAKTVMRAALSRYWETLLTSLDSDGNGVISISEFTACVLSPERFKTMVTAVADAVAGLSDHDGSGRVERGYLRKLLASINIDPSSSDAMFDALGPDEQDSVRTDRWNESVRDFYDPEKFDIPVDLLVLGRRGKAPDA
ncbi:EF-hand domain-containing protein [Streptomyces sp. NPDC127068]|uniref:EF-hand domain-containing protein n=1 Tax=Streptomyces sp. NPDC127068 TaxID=3347127 RepID=UPI0036484CB6